MTEAEQELFRVAVNELREALAWAAQRTRVTFEALNIEGSADPGPEHHLGRMNADYLLKYGEYQRAQGGMNMAVAMFEVVSRLSGSPAEVAPLPIEDESGS